ncbi:ImmA/IrrE family metallo-endopeptidase [Mammaliicoccus sciuri]|uniref:ImmA/IrrE family metallo-endopeptidase n=1 Tax=Mammaliicoccus sciuri TaxID=1296 RepID=UPI000CD26046|nr:ImmA/IrrE family metallo-endopeptidase [Mammaliicoccus sciuri]PNZ27164.1 hypothetical protein CD114_06235 [Mammaliicoccus sciuri]
MRIEQEVNEVIEVIELSELPVNIENIAYIFNIIILHNDDINACMTRRGNTIICLKRDTQHEMWKQFTHELGHFFLHHTDQQTANKMLNIKQEAEANKFSILFRMPQSVIEENNLFTEQELVRHFEVSYEEARERLRLLLNYYAAKKVGTL